MTGENQHQCDWEAKVTSFTEKIDALAVEFQQSQKLAKERHEAMMARFAELTRLVTGDKEVPTLLVIGNDDEAEVPKKQNQIDIPLFEGTDAFTWFEKVESLFDLGKYTDEEKLDMVSLRLSGKALIWYKWEVRHVSFASWVEFKRKVRMRFGFFKSLRSDSVQEKVVLLTEGSSNEEETKIQRKRMLHEKDSCEGSKSIMTKESVEKEESCEEEDLLQSTSLTLDKPVIHQALTQELESREVPITFLESSNQDDSLGDCVLDLEVVNQDIVLKHIEKAIVCDGHATIGIFNEERPTVQEVAHEYQILDVKETISYNWRKITCSRFWIFKFKARKKERLQQKKKATKWLKSWRFKFKTGLETLMIVKLLCGKKVMAVATILHEESKFLLKHKWKTKLLQPVLENQARWFQFKIMVAEFLQESVCEALTTCETLQQWRFQNKPQQIYHLLRRQNSLKDWHFKYKSRTLKRNESYQCFVSMFCGTIIGELMPLMYYKNCLEYLHTMVYEMFQLQVEESQRLLEFLKVHGSSGGLILVLRILCFYQLLHLQEGFTGEMESVITTQERISCYHTT